MEKPVILVYGRDSALLGTRRMVLASAGYQVTEAINFCEVEKILSERSIDLLILCHSLSEADCKEVSEKLQVEPRPKALVLTAGPFGCHVGINAEITDAREGPAKLISTVKRLFCRECSSGNSANNAFGASQNA